MPDYPYLIVGGGMSAAAAVQAIHELDPDEPIGLIGAEDVAPYDRPPLSKGLWFGDDEEVVRHELPEDALALHLGRHVREVDLAGRTVIDERGGRFGYERLLLATGSRPRHLEGAEPGERILYYRTLADYHAVRERARPGARVAVVGGGFIGEELAAGLCEAGCEVTLAFPQAAIGGHRFPPALARSLSAMYRERGIEVAPGRRLRGAREEDDSVTLAFDDGSRLRADFAVIAVGVEPNVELARRAGLEVDDGVVVDEALRAGREDVFACGDIARFFQPDLGVRLRVEHEDHAHSSGRLAGRAMAGDVQPYRHLPFFYSDLFDQGYEAVGRVDSSLRMVEDWREPQREGVVYYLDGPRVRGVLLWNVFGRVDEARALIGLGEDVADEGLRGRIPA